jgi:hypothetical protein
MILEHQVSLEGVAAIELRLLEASDLHGLGFGHLQSCLLRFCTDLL